jgi:hypothetical protein
MTTLGLIVLADIGTFRVATTVFIYLKQIISNRSIKQGEKNKDFLLTIDKSFDPNHLRNIFKK